MKREATKDKKCGVNVHNHFVFKKMRFNYKCCNLPVISEWTMVLNNSFKNPKSHPSRRISVHVTSSQFLQEHGILQSPEHHYNNALIEEIGLAIKGSVVRQVGVVNVDHSWNS